MPDRETPVLVFDCPPQGFQLPQCFLCTQWTQHFHCCSYRSHTNNKLAKTFRCSVLDYSSRSPVRSPLCCYEPSTLLLDFRPLCRSFPFLSWFLSFFFFSATLNLANLTVKWVRLPESWKDELFLGRLLFSFNMNPNGKWNLDGRGSCGTLVQEHIIIAMHLAYFPKHLFLTGSRLSPREHPWLLAGGFPFTLPVIAQLLRHH